jgi:hypothetical protein
MKQPRLTVGEVAEYYSMVLGPRTGITLTTTTTFRELKNIFDVKSEARMLEWWSSSLAEAYKILLQQKPQYARPDGRYRVFFCPSEKFLSGKYRYVIGSDPFLYGWNLVGRTIEDLWYGWNPEYAPQFVYVCYHVALFLFSQMKDGISITLHVGKTPMEIYHYMHTGTDIPFPTPCKIQYLMKKWTEGTLENSDLIHLEFRYPRNLALFILRRNASTFYTHQNTRFINNLFSSCLRVLEKRDSKILNLDFDLEKKQEWARRLEDLLLADKLPLPLHQNELLKNSRRQQWTPEIARRHEALHPNGSWTWTNHSMGVLSDPKNAMLILSEDNDGMSPMFYHGDLRYCEKTFPTVYHLAIVLVMQKLELPFKDAYDKIYKKDAGLIDGLWKKRMRLLLFHWMKTKMQQRPLWMRHLILTKDIDGLFFYDDAIDFIQTQMRQFVSVCYRRMQLHDKNRLELWTYLQKLDHGTDPVLHERLERFLTHFLHTLHVAGSDLGMNTHDLRVVKKLFRIVYPSLCVIQSSSSPSSQALCHLPPCLSTGNQEVDAYLENMLLALGMAWKTGGGSSASGAFVKPKCMKETVRKVSLLYQNSSKNDDVAPTAIESILSGCRTWDEKDSDTLSFPRVAAALFAEYPGTKNADKTVKKNLGKVVMALHKNRAYQQF